MSSLELHELVRRDATYADVCGALSEDADTLAAEIGHLHSFESECAAHIAARVAACQAAVWAANGNKQIGWTKWVAEHLPFGIDQAKRYLKIHREIGARAHQFEGRSARSILKQIAAEQRDKEREAEEATLAEVEEMVTECTDPVDTGKTEAPVVEADAATKIAKIAQRLENAQAIVGAAKAEVDSLFNAAQGSEAEWLRDLRDWVRTANDALVEFVDLGMSGGGL